MSSGKKVFFTAIVLVALSTVGCFNFKRMEVITVKAQVVLENSPTVTGVLILTQSTNSLGVRIVGQIRGLAPGNHGFHIHEFGDIVTQGCGSTGTHFNPLNQQHGPLNDLLFMRHRGDFGNIVADATGVANIDIVNNQISLMPRLSIGDNVVVGRAFVVHALTDDLGQGGNADSLTTGNAGQRLACGVIKLV